MDHLKSGLSAEQIDRLFFIVERAKGSRIYNIANAIFAMFVYDALETNQKTFTLYWEADPYRPFHYDLLSIRYGNGSRYLTIPVPILSEETAQEALRKCGLSGNIGKRIEHKRPYAPPYKGLRDELWRELFQVIRPEHLRQEVGMYLQDSHSFNVDEVIAEIERRANIAPEYPKAHAFLNWLDKQLMKALAYIRDMERTSVGRRRAKQTSRYWSHFNKLYPER